MDNNEGKDNNSEEELEQNTLKKKFVKRIKKKKITIDTEKIPSIIKSVIKEKGRLDEEIRKLDDFWSKNKPETADNPVAALAILKNATEKINVIKDDFSKNCKALELLKSQCSNPNKLEGMKKEVEEFYGLMKQHKNNFHYKFEYKYCSFLSFLKNTKTG